MTNYQLFSVCDNAVPSELAQRTQAQSSQGPGSPRLSLLSLRQENLTHSVKGRHIQESQDLSPSSFIRRHTRAALTQGYKTQVWLNGIHNQEPGIEAARRAWRCLGKGVRDECVAGIIKKIKCCVSFESGFESECIGACKAIEANLCSNINPKMC